MVRLKAGHYDRSFRSHVVDSHAVQRRDRLPIQRGQRGRPREPVHEVASLTIVQKKEWNEALLLEVRDRAFE